MIQSIEVKNYQSHVDTHVELAPFTVLVGQSSAGKSAFVRAMKAMTSNQSGKDFITHGQQTAQVKFTTDKGTITLTKGKPEDSYVILENNDIKNPRRYTKLGTAVPEDVTKFLGIAAKDAINFAGQFDMPFLLTASGASVASTLGELTNVSAIFEASREGNRLKNSYSALLKTRQSDLTGITSQVEGYAELDTQIENITAAEEALTRLEQAQARLSHLNDLMLTVQTATGRLRAAERRTAYALPTTEHLWELVNRLNDVNHLIYNLSAESKAKADAQARIDKLTTELSTIEDSYIQLLHDAGTCPTCGQNTKEITHDHVHA